MNTLNKLQAILKSKINFNAGYESKEQAPTVICKDGTQMSVQASAHHYCTPRTNKGPYTHVEIWCVQGELPTEFFYDPEKPSVYVPIEKIAQFIDSHGGFK